MLKRLSIEIKNMEKELDPEKNITIYAINIFVIELKKAGFPLEVSEEIATNITLELTGVDYNEENKEILKDIFLTFVSTLEKFKIGLTSIKNKDKALVNFSSKLSIVVN